MKLEIDIPSILYQDAKENGNYISVTKLEIAWKAIADGKPLEQEPTTKNDLGVDAISREQAIEEADKLCLETGYDNEKVIEMLNDLPSITPQPRKGHWIRISPAEIYECSECGQNVMTSDICVYKFCHGCGIKMVELQESEVEDGEV